MNAKPLRQVVAAAVSLLALGAAAAEAGPVYLPLGNGDRLAVVDHETGKPMAEVEGLPAPHGVAATPDGRYLVVGSFAEREPGTAMPERPKGMAQAEHEKHHAKAERAMEAVATIAVLDRQSLEVVRRIDVPGAVHHVAVSPDGRFAAFTHPATGKVTVVDLERMEVAATVAVGEAPNYVLFAPDGKLYVSNAGSSDLAVLESGSWRTVRRIKLPGGPEHMALAPDGSRLYLAGAADGKVWAVDTASGEVVASADLGDVLHGIDLDADRGRVYVAVLGADRLVALDADTLKVVDERRFAGPYHVTVIGPEGRLFVTSAAEPVLHVWSLEGLAHVGVEPVGAVGHQMAHL